jgi:L-cystine transport system permease protein
VGKMYDFKLVPEYLPLILSRLHITLLLVIFATVIGFILGLIIALFRIYRIPVLNQIAIIFISFVRGTPIIVQMFIVFYGFPFLLMKVAGININRWDKMNFVIVTYGLNSAAFMAEIIRASIISVAVGQSEAAYSVGLTRLQTFFRIVAPQAVQIALPSFGTSLVGLLQDTSLAYSLGIIDVMGKVQSIGSRTYHLLEGYIGAAIIFIVLSTLIEKGSSLIEKKVAYKKM